MSPFSKPDVLHKFIVNYSINTVKVTKIKFWQYLAVTKLSTRCAYKNIFGNNFVYKFGLTPEAVPGGGVIRGKRGPAGLILYSRQCRGGRGGSTAGIRSAGRGTQTPVGWGG